MLLETQKSVAGAEQQPTEVDLEGQRDPEESQDRWAKVKMRECRAREEPKC